MWFLQMDIMVRMIIASIVMALALPVALKFGKQAIVMRLMAVIDLLLILYVSEKLAVFYAGYVIVTYAVLQFLKSRKKFRKFWFAVCCIVCCVPFLYARAAGFYAFLPTFGLTMIGIAYNMLKAVDAVFYVYYTEEKISFITYANFILFFPVITAGPIFRYRDFIKTYEHPAPVTADALQISIRRIILGLFKKVVVLFFVYKAFNHFLVMPGHWYVSLAIAVTSYCILYLDMSGYADIAIGLGRLVGISVPENFKNPLESPSFTQFWHNWHITLSDWIREHISVLVKGKKLGKVHGALMGFFVMLFMGLWHEFSWLFLLNGVFNGALLAGENLLGITTVKRRKVSRRYYIFRCVLTNAIFAVNTMCFTLSTTQLLTVLNGFLKL
jgi:alginate O-acetyltransferase complex protein AlgI